MNRTITVAALLFCASSFSASAVSLLSQDLFETTSEGWVIGSRGVFPTREAGPGADGQAGFLQHFSDNSGNNGKWLMWSEQSDWLGNYISAGVTGISLFADNRAGNPLPLRIAFNGPGGWFYSSAQTITNTTAGDDWTPLSFPLTAGNFTHLGGGTGILADTLGAVSLFEIFGGSGSVVVTGAGFLQAGNSTNTIAIDSIVAVPEPAAWAGFLSMAAFALLRRRRC